MKNFSFLVFCSFILSFYSSINARESIQSITNSRPILRPRAGDCKTGTPAINLDVNNVRAKLLNTGDMWWDRSIGSYGVPKLSLEEVAQKKQQVVPLFSGSIWVSGKDNGNLKIASLRFSSGGAAQFWPGPIQNLNPVIEKATCEKFNRFWEVTSKDINDFLSNGVISDNIKNWPGKGNPELISSGKFTAQDLSENLAPFYDENGDGIYNPKQGDYPTIKMSGSNLIPAVADQMIFWVMNDVGNAHSIPDGAPIGVQMNCLAFAFQTADELNNMTFYTYEITNKSNSNLSDSYMAQFVDCDLGNAKDDYVGCDTIRDLGYCYNADNLDENTDQVGYGDELPIVATDFFEGPKDQTGKPIGMSSFTYFLNVASGDFSDPGTDLEHRNVMEGKTRYGKDLTEGGNCSGGSKKTKYCFPGDPMLPGPVHWSMCSENLSKNDIRYVQSSGPFELASGNPVVISVGVIFVRQPKGGQAGCNANIQRYLIPADEKAQALFDFNFVLTPGPDAPYVFVNEEDEKVVLNLFNKEGSNNFGESYNSRDYSIPNARVADTSYKFEGYQIFQVLSPSATNLDLSNDAKAKLVAQFDVRNSVKGEIVNYTDKYINGVLYKTINESITLDNKGIDKMVVVTKDLFQQEGASKLINNKSYYFAIRAFAYNNYQDSFDKLNVQKSQIKFSNVLRVVSAIPHVTEYYGTKLNASYGDYINVKRITGKGHGNYFLNLAVQAEEDDIIKNSSRDVLTYTGGLSPIRVRVTDPYKLKNSKFKLTLTDYSGASGENLDVVNTRWELDIDNGNRIVKSDANIERTYEQSIYAKVGSELDEYGITVETSFADTLMTNPRDNKMIYKYIGGQVVFSDTTKKWLKFMADEDEKVYKDWIRSVAKNDDKHRFDGAYTLTTSGTRIYTDPFSEFSKIIGSTIAPYCLAANNAVTSSTYSHNYSSYAPGFKWKRLTTDENTMVASHQFPENNLDSLFSVDIVISKDPEKWSECIVLETGENRDINEFNAIKGQIRKAPGRGKDMKEDPNMPVGKSFFPGYAINLETGVRVNIYFGENSSIRGVNGGNMIWDPSSIGVNSLDAPVMGGGHFVYVTNTPYDKGEADRQLLTDNFNKVTGTGNSEELSPIFRPFYRSLAWTFIPLADTGMSFYDASGNYKIPSDVRIQVRVQKPYAFYNSSGLTSVYEFSTEGLAPVKNGSLAEQAFENMKIVPNPYNAYSVYELNSIQNVVKFVNVPQNSKITIFTTDGILVRKIQLSDPGGSGNYGAQVSDGEINTDNSYSWDMRTTTGVIISSGVYYVNVEAPGLGTKVMKLFATMRSPDVSKF